MTRSALRLTAKVRLLARPSLELFTPVFNKPFNPLQCLQHPAPSTLLSSSPFLPSGSNLLARGNLIAGSAEHRFTEVRRHLVNATALVRQLVVVAFPSLLSINELSSRRIRGKKKQQHDQKPPKKDMWTSPIRQTSISLSRPYTTSPPRRSPTGVEADKSRVSHPLIYDNK